MAILVSLKRIGLTFGNFLRSQRVENIQKQLLAMNYSAPEEK